ncbi:hypothetical protein [Phaeobacter inhibens]|uniref:Uncharacterized protein n=1 Tax=Phaeobacter inhibens TaxID=221822 RepID=A0A2I7K6J4_9RHOB|nr:hypothetical protein [Phaeobacter inhibens]AUQ98110.1 hypothetical protein PhaeoP88_00714 [Phaeobacter inhibens]
MTQLYHTATSAPAPLPFRIRLSDGRSRTDPASFTAEEIADAGYIAAPPPPDHDPASQRLTWDGAAWGVEDIPVPDPVYQPLTKIGFMRLCMFLGGMTPEMLVAAREAPELKAMWIMLDMAEQVQRDDPEVAPGLALLAGLGHLPNGAQAVLDGWPAA